MEKKKLLIIITSMVIASILAFSTFKEQTNVYAFALAEEETFGGSNYEIARAVAIWGTSKVIVGYTNSFDAGDYDAFIAVKNGATLYMWTIGTSNHDYAYAVAVADDYAYIVGTTNNPNNYYDIFIAQWDLSTNSLLNTKFIASGINNPRADIATAVATDGTYVFVTGRWHDDKFFLAILDANLNIINFASLDFGPGNDVAYAIDFSQSDSTYRIIIAGGTNTISFGGYDAFITRIDWDGVNLNVIWSLRFGTTGNDAIYSLKTTGAAVVVGGFLNNNGLIAGFTIDGGFVLARATVFSNPSIITSIAISGSYLYAVGYFSNPPNQDDALILQIDNNGALVDAKGYGKGTIDRAFGIAIDGSDINVVGGTSTYPNNVYDATSLFSYRFVQWNPLVIPPTYTPYMRSQTISLTIASITPPTYSPTVSTSPVTPTINSPSDVEAFYVRFT